MSTFTDTSVRISLATPQDIQDLSQKSLHLWVGATSPLWAPFWAAASFGVGLWALGQGAARTLGGTLYDKDLPLALKWPGFEALPKSVEALNASVAEAAAHAAVDGVEKAEAVVAGTAESVTDAVETAAGASAEIAPEPALVEETPIAAVEAASVVTDAATSEAAKISAESAKKAAEATLDLLGSPSTPETTKPARQMRPLIDPVTEKPVIPAVAEATAETKPPMPKAAPRRSRKT